MEQVYAFGYSRKSPDDKESTDTSIRNQNELIKMTCEKKMWRLQSIEEDKDISGGDKNRRGIQMQIEKSLECKKQNPDSEVYIIVKDSKRFSRDSSFFRSTLEKLNEKEVKVFSISKNNFLNYKDIGDRVMSVVDEQIIIDAKENAKLTQNLKQSQSLPSIPAPFGYKYNWIKDSRGNKKPIDKAKDMGNWVVDKFESKKVTSVISDYLDSVSRKETMKKNRISKGKYYRILKNARLGLYSGYIVYHKKGKDEVRYKGTHEPIISGEFWEKLKAITF